MKTLWNGLSFLGTDFVLASQPLQGFFMNTQNNSQELDIQVNEFEDKKIAIVAIIGNFTNSTIFSDIIEGLYDKNIYKIILNCDNVFWITSSVLGAMIHYQEISHQNGGEILISECKSSLMHAIFCTICCPFNVFSSLQEALDYFTHPKQEISAEEANKILEKLAESIMSQEIQPSRVVKLVEYEYDGESKAFVPPKLTK